MVNTTTQIDYILIQNRFKSGINREKTRTFPGADIGSDHDLVMMKFQVRLNKQSKSRNNWIRFDFEKLKDATISNEFKATLGKKFTHLLTLEDDLVITTNKFIVIMVETAKKIVRKSHLMSKPWVTNKILDLNNAQHSLKQKKNTRKVEQTTER